MATSSFPRVISQHVTATYDVCTVVGEDHIIKLVEPLQRVRRYRVIYGNVNMTAAAQVNVHIIEHNLWSRSTFAKVIGQVEGIISTTATDYTGNRTVTPWTEHEPWVDCPIMKLSELRFRFNYSDGTIVALDDFNIHLEFECELQK